MISSNFARGVSELDDTQKIQFPEEGVRRVDV